MRVLAFGTYQREYPRNAQVRSCLRQAGVEVAERHVSVWDRRRESWSAGPAALPRLVAAELRLGLGDAPDTDVVLVGYPGQLDLPAARRVAGARPVVFDPLVSWWDTLVHDRGRFRPTSLAARALFAIDRASFRAADVVMADTVANARFYIERFRLPESRVHVCFVGAEERLFSHRAAEPDRFHALFVGKLIPLHGLDTILAAARLVPEIPFRIVGSGQLEPMLARAPASVARIPWVDYERLPLELEAAGCALGIFGTSSKAARVIPNKAFQALATGVPLVTADTPAARELLSDGENALLVPAGDPAALALAVERLATDPDLRRRIGAAGRIAYENDASEAVLGQRWRSLLEDVLR